MATVKTEVRRTGTVRAWAGTSGDLLLVARQIEDALAEALNRAVAEVVEPLEQLATAKALKNALRLDANVASTAGDVSGIGPAADVLDTFQPRDVKEIVLENQPFMAGTSTQISVEFNPTNDHGVRVLVVGAEPTWVYGWFDAIMGEVRRHHMWWGWIRNEVVGFAALTLSALLLATPFAWLTDNGDSWPAWYTVAGLVGMVLGGIATPFWRRRVLPGFELHAPGQTARGSRHLRGVISTVVALATLAGLGVGIAALKK